MYPSVDLSAAVYDVKVMHIGDRIREARERLGLSQFDLAVKVNTRPETIGRYERNKMQPGADVVVRLADALGVPGGWLLGDALDGTSDPVHDEELPALDRALALFRPLAPEIEQHIRRRHHDAVTFLDGGSMSTLVGFIEDEIAKWKRLQDGASPKVKQAPFTEVTVPDGAMRREPKKKRG